MMIISIHFYYFNGILNNIHAMLSTLWDMSIIYRAIEPANEIKMN